jgi:UDPglucose 6-dehydrogenase
LKHRACSLTISFLQLATHRPGVSFEVLSNPEFLAEGTAVKNLTAPDRVLIGSAATPSGRLAAQTLANLYAAWVPPSRIIETNAWSSELAKLVANAMLAQRISSINSISAICERTGAEVDQVAKAIGMDVRIGPQFLKAGLGFGGSCFRKDIASLAYLAESLGLDDVAHYWRQVNVMNERQRDRFSRKIIDRFEGNLVGRKLAMLGFAFKKNTGDTRESLAVEVVRALLEERPAEIAIFDPYCRQEDILRELEAVCPSSALGQIVKVHPDPYLACSQAHAVLVVTDCDQFRNTSSRKSSKQSILPPVQKELARSTANEMGEEKSKRACARQDDETWTHAGVSYQLRPQEACTADCSDCRSAATRPTATEAIEWTRIAYNMVEPKWVFDGRGLLDAAELERLGVRVDVVGRRTRETVA